MRHCLISGVFYVQVKCGQPQNLGKGVGRVAKNSNWLKSTRFTWFYKNDRMALIGDSLGLITVLRLKYMKLLVSSWSLIWLWTMVGLGLGLACCYILKSRLCLTFRIWFHKIRLSKCDNFWIWENLGKFARKYLDQ